MTTDEALRMWRAELISADQIHIQHRREQEVEQQRLQSDEIVAATKLATAMVQHADTENIDAQTNNALVSNSDHGATKQRMARALLAAREN